MSFLVIFTTQKMRFSIKGFFSKCDQIHRKLGMGISIENYQLISQVSLVSPYKTIKNYY